VHQRTGVPLAELRVMTLAGWVPWLADTLAPVGTDAYTTFVQQDSVLFAPGGTPTRGAAPVAGLATHHRFRRPDPAWLPTVRGPAPGRGLPLMAQSPVMLSCVEHECALLPASHLLPFIAGFAAQDAEPVPVSEAVTVMDRRTHEAVTTGTVQLPAERSTPESGSGCCGPCSTR
jgi:hypothetical protein